jgi:predicted DNA-binding protein (MmcQ/YjbR family)
MQRAPITTSVVKQSEIFEDEKMDEEINNDNHIYNFSMSFKDLCNINYKYFIIVNNTKKTGLHIKFCNKIYTHNDWSSLLYKMKTNPFFGIIFMNIPNKKDETTFLELLYKIKTVSPKRKINHYDRYNRHDRFPYYDDSFNMVRDANYLGIWFPKQLVTLDNGSSFISKLSNLDNNINLGCHLNKLKWMSKYCQKLSSFEDITILKIKLIILWTVISNINVPNEILFMICKYIGLNIPETSILLTLEDVTYIRKYILKK